MSDSGTVERMWTLDELKPVLDALQLIEVESSHFLSHAVVSRVTFARRVRSISTEGILRGREVGLPL